MLPRWLEQLSVLGLLLVAVVLRTQNLASLPLGFVQEELAAIAAAENIRDGNIQVFYNTPPEGGQESLYVMLNTVATLFVGDGLFSYRLFGLWANLIALALFYYAVRGLFGPSVGLVALAVMVSSLWGVLAARAVTSNALTPLLVTAVLALIVRTFRLYRPIAPKPPSTFWYTALGLTVSAGIYTHYLGVVLAVGLALFIVYMWRTHQPVSRWVWNSSAFMLALILILSLPYLISVIRSTGESSLAFFWRERPRDLVDLGDSLLRMLGAFFYRGDSDPTHNMPSLPLLWPVWFLLALGGLWMTIQRWREPAYGLIILMLPLSLLPEAWLREGPHFPALTLAHFLLCILAALGAYFIGRHIHLNHVMGGWRFVALLIGMGLAFTIWQTQTQLLDNWPNRPDVAEAYHSHLARLANYLDSTPDEPPALVCVENLTTFVDESGELRRSEPEIMGFMMHQSDDRVRYAACQTTFVLLDGGEPMRVIMTSPSQAADANSAVLSWLQRREIINIEGLPLGSVGTLESESELAALAGQLQLNSPLYYPREGAAPEVVALPVRLGRNITLLGYNPFPNHVYLPDDVLPITTYWRVDGDPPPYWGVFVRLHDSPQSSPYTEANALDTLPMMLHERDVVIQTNYLSIPETLLPGEYILTLGAYDNNPLNQIEVFSAEATLPRGTYLTAIPRLRVVEE